MNTFKHFKMYSQFYNKLNNDLSVTKNMPKNISEIHKYDWQYTKILGFYCKLCPEVKEINLEAFV